MENREMECRERSSRERVKITHNSRGYAWELAVEINNGTRAELLASIESLTSELNAMYDMEAASIE